MSTRYAFPEQVEAFKATWPANGLPPHLSISASFDDHNGDLVDLSAWVEGKEIDTAEIDGSALKALVDDMQNFALAPCLGHSDLRAEFNLAASGDSWGETMGWWFAIAAELTERGLPVPDDWQYRPSPLGARDPDAYETDFCAAATDDALQSFGALMHRYAQRLKHAGRSY